MMEQHNWPRIIAVSRELLRVLKQTSATIPPKPAESRADSLQFSAVNHQVGNLWTQIYHLLTIDPNDPDGCHWVDDDKGKSTVRIEDDDGNVTEHVAWSVTVADGLWLCYQEHHEIRADVLRLWQVFSRTITPRFNEFGRWPTYSEAELNEFEAALDALDRATKGQGDEAADDPPAAVHSPDFRSVNWFGKQYSFTGNQAAAVKLLWEAWQSGAPDVGGETLLQAADASTQRIDVVFRGNAAWGAMIVQGGTKGSYRLAEPTAILRSGQSGQRKKTSARARK